MEAVEYVLQQDEGRERVLLYAKQLSEAFALSVPHEEALKIRDDVGFFQAVRSQLVKLSGDDEKRKKEKDIESAIKQLVSKAVSSDEVINLSYTWVSILPQVE